MNANEVIASVAAARRACDVHPNDHVNASQSSNDVFPTTIHLAATEALATDVVPALEHLAAALRRRAADWADVVKAGPHAPDGRRADHARPGGGRLGHAGGVRRRAGARRAAPAGRSCRSAAPRSAPGSTPPRASAPAVVGGTARGHRARRAVRGPRPHRGAGRPGRAGRGVGRAAHRRGLAVQDRQRHPLARLRPAHRARRAAPARPAAGQLDHARQGQPGDLRGHDDGGGAGDRQRRDRRVLRAARATCSST